MTTLALVIAAAAVALGLGRWLRLPAAPLGIVAGLGLSLSPAPLDTDHVRGGLALAATFLLFAVSAEIDRRDVRRYRRAAWATAVVYLTVTGMIAAVAGSILGLELRTTVYLTLALTSSSTLLVVQLLRRRERFFEPIGRFVTGVVLAQDALVVVGLTVAVVAEAGASRLGWTALSVAALLGVAWFSARQVVPRVLRGSRLGSEEQLLFVLGVLVAFGAACWALDLPLVLGAYLAGAVFSPFPVGGIVRGYVASFADFFTVLFFVLLGAVLVIPRPDELAADAILVGAVLLVRPLLLLPLARRIGLTVRSSIEAVTLLSNAGELGLVVVLVALDRGLVPESLLSVVAMVAVITMSLTPWLSGDRAVSSSTHYYPARRPPPVARDLHGHVVLIGCGEAGRVLLKHLQAEDVPVVVVDDDPDVIGRIVSNGAPAVRGDGADPKVLRAAGAHRAAAIVSTMRRRGDNAALLARASGRPVLVQVFAEAAAEEVRRLGGTPVVEASLASDAFLRWYERRPGRDSARTGPP